MKLRRKTITPERAAGEATVANGAMAAMQIGASALTGNLGFVGESLHNAGDSVSFWAKRSAMNTDPEKSLKRRRIAAYIFGMGGVAGLSAAAYEFTSRYEESTSTAAMSIAVACAALNTYVARRTHRAVKDETTGELVHMCDHDHTHDEHDDEHHHHHEKEMSSQKTAALLDAKIHAFNDAGTGWLYVFGLLGQKYGVHDAATWAVAVNGAIATTGATFTLARVQRDGRNTAEEY